jgi:hypothetical protein
MSTTWRRIAPVTAAAGALTAGLLMAALPAQAKSTPDVTATVQPGYSATIAATSPNFPDASRGKVDGYAVVVFGTRPSAYHWTRNWHAAKISGQVSGAHAGDVVTLYAEPFGTSFFTSTGKQVTLASTGTESYSFSVQPQRETRYEVQVTSTNPNTFDTESAAQTVYVILEGVPGKVKTRCSSDHCKITAELKVLVPAAAYKTESAKHFYFYFGLDIPPRFPTFLRLDRSASAKKAHKLSAREFEVAATVRFSSTLAHPQDYEVWTFCLKDAESKDGIGLPGHHGCGAARVKTLALYLG